MAFYDCRSLTSISIPDSVTSIGGSAFSECSGLTSIAIPDSVTVIESNVFSGCSGLTSIAIPDSVTVIGLYAFNRCSGLTSIAIPDSVISIMDDAFYGCSSLTSIAIPYGDTSIGEATFYGCSSLTSITIPNSITYIGDDAFYGCSSLTDVYYVGSKSDWESILLDNISNAPLLNATIHYNSTGPDDVDWQTVSGILRSGGDWNIRWECSYNLDASGNPHNGRVEITASESNTKEELYLYNDASADGFPWELDPYNIPKSAITSLLIRGSLSKTLRITANSFTGYSNLRTVALNGVSGIDSNAFYGCSSLTQVAFAEPDNTLTLIGNGAFQNCTCLSKFNFPAALTSIGVEAFRNTALGDVILWRNLAEIGETAFADCPSLKISCYENSVAYRHAVENNIPFQLIAEPDDMSIKATPIQFHLGEAGKINMSIDWGWNLFDLASSKYDDRLAAVGLALSSAAEHSKSEAMFLLDTLGFGKVQPRNYGENWQEELWHPAVVFGYQKVYGQHIFAIVIRGTNPDEAEDIVSDITAGGFIMSARNISSQLTEFIQTVCGLNLSELQDNCKFFVAGHSLGGATANVLAKTLSDDYGTGNVFAYTFAPPRPIDAVTGASGSGKYNNIHNIVNLEDGWPRMPPTALFTRYGETIFFHRKKTDQFYDNFELLTGREFDKNISAHDTAVYMSFVLSNQINGSIRVIRCACPVDIEIYDSAGILVGCVKNNVVSETESEKVYICVEGTEKYLYLLVVNDYTIKIIGTDEGTMTYGVHELDMSSGETTAKIIYENVTLS